MAKEKDDESFHVKAIPGRPLMNKRLPTKRTFTFHLPEFKKTKKSSLQSKENESMRRRNKSNISTGSNESSIVQRKITNTSNVSSGSVPQKNILKDKTNTTKAVGAGGKHVLVAVKDLANTQKIPVSASKPCEMFETPFLPLFPLASLQRRLVDACGSFSLRKSSEASRSTLSTNSDSKIMIPGLIAPNRSGISISESIRDVMKYDDKECGRLQRTVSENASIAECLNFNVSKCVNTEESKLTDILVSVEKNTRFNNKKLLPQFHMEKIKKSSPQCEKFVTEKSEINFQSASHEESELKSDSYLFNVHRSESSRDTNDKSIIAMASSSEEKILNTPFYNNLGQSKRRRVTLEKSNIKSSISKGNDIQANGECSSSNILLISPLSVPKLQRSVLSKSNECSKLETMEGLENLHTQHTSKDLGEKLKLRQPQVEPSANFVTLGMKRKHNFFENSSELGERSSDSVTSSCKSQASLRNCTKLSNIKVNYSLPQEFVNRMTRNIMKNSHLKYNVLWNETQVLKDSKQKKPKKRIVAQVSEFPEKVKALLWKKTPFKRDCNDVTDLEIVLHIFAKNMNDIRGRATNAKSYEILKAYEKAVTADLTKLISQTVELQNKQKEMNRLYRKLRQKGKELGALVDERHKLSYDIEIGKVRLKE